MRNAGSNRNRGINFNMRDRESIEQGKCNMNLCCDPSAGPLPKTPRLTENGYRVVAVYDSHDSIEVFPDSADGRQRAIDLAKSLCRHRQERERLCAEGRLDSPDSIMLVQRFQTDIEVLGLFSPQERPDFQRFGHLPGGYDPSALATVLSTNGEWSCLKRSDDEPVADETEKLRAKLQPLVQSLENAVLAASRGQSFPSLADWERCCSEYDELFCRLYEVSQQRKSSHGPRDFTDALANYDPEFAGQVAAEFDAAQRRIMDAVTNHFHALASELPDHQRDQAVADLRAFIYEVLLAGLCDHSEIR